MTCTMLLEIALRNCSELLFFKPQTQSRRSGRKSILLGMSIFERSTDYNLLFGYKRYMLRDIINLRSCFQGIVLNFQAKFIVV